jgi:multiple sugar transport system substrate-binding protein
MNSVNLWENQMKIRISKLLAAVAVLALTSTANAGEYDGYTLRVKLIGGAQYEPLYKLIPEWEKTSGAKVEILSRKSHFELDRRCDR